MCSHSFMDHLKWQRLGRLNQDDSFDNLLTLIHWRKKWEKRNYSEMESLVTTNTCLKEGFTLMGWIELPVAIDPRISTELCYFWKVVFDNNCMRVCVPLNVGIRGSEYCLSVIYWNNIYWANSIWQNLCWVLGVKQCVMEASSLRKVQSSVEDNTRKWK